MDEFYDITAKVGPLWPLPLGGQKVEIPMYSFERPSCLLWNSIGKALHEKGWTDQRIAEWLSSKATRWALDDDLGDEIRALGRRYADKIAP